MDAHRFLLTQAAYGISAVTAFPGLQFSAFGVSLNLMLFLSASRRVPERVSEEGFH